MFTAVAGSTTNLEICRNFTPVSPPGVPRFKVDPDGGWGGDEFPASDTPTSGWTKIVVNKNNKTIVSITKDMAANCGIASSSSSKSSNSSLPGSSSNSSVSLSSSSVSSNSMSSSSSSKSASSSSVAAVAHDFRGRTAYYVMLDRFENGDKTNDAGVSTAPAVDPVEWKKYWGGDIDGLISKLDYLKSLGVNAVVVSSLVDNSALGYHGFWGRDFYAVDEHLAKDLAKVKELDKALEDRGMKLVMEITLNNASNETGEVGKLWKATDPVVTDFTNGVTAGWYHKNESIGVDGCATKALCDAEWYDPAKYLTKSVSGRPDFVQGTDGKNSIADEYLIGAAKLWMDNGVDGFRIHSTKFIEPSFVERFSAAVREKNADAYIFGDWPETADDIPLVKTFVKDGHGVELTDIDLRNHLEGAIAGDETMEVLSAHLNARQTVLASKANVQAIYLDSYAESRTSVLLRAKTTEKTSRGVAGKAMTQATADARQNIGVAMVMTLPGVPVIYYGTEANVATLTANASGEIGGDPFNREKIDFTAAKKPAFSLIKALSDLRSTSKAIQEGGYEQRWVNDDVLVYQRESADGDCAVVAINRGATMTASIHIKRLCLKAGPHTNLLNATDAAVSVVRNAATPDLEGETDLTLKENQVIVLHN